MEPAHQRGGGQEREVDRNCQLHLPEVSEIIWGLLV
jgi:hypothetical protein